MANTSILAAFERMWQHIVAALNNKSDKFYVDELASELKIYKQPEEPTDASEGALWVDMDAAGSGGGSSGGSGGSASSWADLAVIGYTDGIILDGTDAIYVEDSGMHVLMESIGVSAGKEYEVCYGTDITASEVYSCVCEFINVDGIDVLALGNTSVLGGTITSDAPFVIMTKLPADAGFGTMIAALDGATSVHITYITGQVEVISPCPSRYLANTQLIVEFTVNKDYTVNLITDVNLTELANIIKSGERSVVAYLHLENSVMVLNVASVDDNVINFVNIYPTSLGVSVEQIILPLDGSTPSVSKTDLNTN